MKSPLKWCIQRLSDETTGEIPGVWLKLQTGTPTHRTLHNVWPSVLWRNNAFKTAHLHLEMERIKRQRHAATCEVYREDRGWRWAESWEWWPSTPASWPPANKQGAKVIFRLMYYHWQYMCTHAIFPNVQKRIGARKCMLSALCQGRIMEHRRFLSHGAAAELLIKAAHLNLRAAATCWDKWPWSDCGGAQCRFPSMCFNQCENLYHTAQPKRILVSI